MNFPMKRAMKYIFKLIWFIWLFQRIYDFCIVEVFNFDSFKKTEKYLRLPKLVIIHHNQGNHVADGERKVK